MEFRDAMGVLAGPPMGGEVAMEAGVSLNSISRARREIDAHYRTPPKNWKAIVRKLALERIESLSALASELADA